MRMVVLAVFALAAMTGVVRPADGQQDSGTSGVVECVPGVNTKECEAAQLDALFKKMDQASAATAALDARRRNAPTYKYMLAIQSAVMRNWLRPDGLPNAECRVQVVQLPGGKVVSATVDPSCPYDGAGRRSVVNAVLRTETLPYQGFESVFQRTIMLVFIPSQSDEAHTGLPFTSGTAGQAYGSRPAGIDANFRAAHPLTYPPEAVRKHHEGRVDVMVLVGADNQVVNAQLRRSSGFKELDAAALDAARSWRYTAAYQGMSPVPSYADVPVTFSLVKPISSFPSGWPMACPNPDHTISSSRVAGPDCTVSGDLLGAAQGTLVHAGAVRTWRLISHDPTYDLYADEGSAMHIGTTVGLWTKMVFRQLRSTLASSTVFQASIQQGTYDCQARSFAYGMSWRYDSFGHPVSIGPPGASTIFVAPALAELFAPLCRSFSVGVGIDSIEPTLGNEAFAVI